MQGHLAAFKELHAQWSQHTDNECECGEVLAIDYKELSTRHLQYEYVTLGAICVPENLWTLLNTSVVDNITSQCKRGRYFCTTLSFY